MQIIFYTADWCPQCKVMYPIIESITEKHDVPLKIVNVGGENEDEYRHILSLPTIEIIKENGDIKMLAGIVSTNKIETEMGLS